VSVILRHDAVQAFEMAWNGGQQIVHITGVEVPQSSYGHRTPDFVCVRVQSYADSIIKVGKIIAMLRV